MEGNDFDFKQIAKLLDYRDLTKDTAEAVSSIIKGLICGNRITCNFAD